MRNDHMFWVAGGVVQPVEEIADHGLILDQYSGSHLRPMLAHNMCIVCYAPKIKFCENMHIQQAYLLNPPYLPTMVWLNCLCRYQKRGSLQYMIILTLGVKTLHTVSSPKTLWFRITSDSCSPAIAESIQNSLISSPT